MQTSGARAEGARAEPIGELADKIVLLGGTIADVDVHYTPLGQLHGAVVLANAIQTELDGGGAFLLPRWSTFLLEFAAGALLLVALHLWSPSLRSTLVLGLALTAAISIVFSIVSFADFARVANFAPTLLFVLAVEIWSHLRQSAILRAARQGDDAEPTGPEAAP
jgi:CHASE2 domain-containing sensor protein